MMPIEEFLIIAQGTTGIKVTNRVEHGGRVTSADHLLNNSQQFTRFSKNIQTQESQELATSLDQKSEWQMRRSLWTQA